MLSDSNNNIYIHLHGNIYIHPPFTSDIDRNRRGAKLSGHCNHFLYLYIYKNEYRFFHFLSTQNVLNRTSWTFHSWLIFFLFVPRVDMKKKALHFLLNASYAIATRLFTSCWYLISSGIVDPRHLNVPTLLIEYVKVFQQAYSVPENP